MLSRSSITAALLAVVVTTGASGCGLVRGNEADPTSGSAEQPAEQPAEEPAEEQSPEPEPSASQSPEPSQSSDDSAEDQGESRDDVLASASAVTTIGADMGISVTEAVVEGQLLRISVSYTLTEATEEVYSVYDFAGGTDPGVYLVDNVNLQRYAIVRTADSQQVASDVVLTQGVGGPTLTYYFAAPPEDVDSLTLAFNAAPWPAIDVPIER